MRVRPVDVFLFLLAPLIVLWPAIFLGQTLGPWDEIRSLAPWSQPAPNRAFDILQLDAALQFYPWRDLVFEAWRQGHFPLWNPYVLMGNPLAGNSQSGAFYPPHILLGVAGVPTGLGITLLAWFHLALAGLGVTALGLRLGGHPTLARLGGLSFALSAFFLAWASLGSVISTVAWIPWIGFGLALLSTAEDRADQARGIGWVAWSTGMLLLAGHLQFVLYGALFGIVLTVGFAVRSRKVLPAVQAATGAALGITISWPQLQMVLPMLALSHRRSAPSEAGWNAYAGSALQWWEWASLPLPDLLGSPARMAGEAFAPLSTYWPAMVKPGANIAESAVAVGPFILGMAILHLRMRTPFSGILATVGILGVLLATASPLARLMYFGMPGWSASGSPGRAAVLVVLALCLLAASGQVPKQPLVSGQPPLKQPVGQALLGTFVVVIIALLSVRLFAPALSSAYPGLDPTTLAEYIRSSISPISGVTFAVVALFMVAHGILKAGERWPQWVTGAALLSLVPNLLLSPMRMGTVPEVSRATEIQRVATTGQRLDLLQWTPGSALPNLNVLSRTMEVGGYDSLIPRSTVEALRTANGRDPAPPVNGNMMWIWPEASDDALASLGVTLRDGTAIDGASGIVTFNGEPVRIESIHAEGLDVRVRGAGILEAKIRPVEVAWSAQINGRTLQAVNDANWPRFEVPGGSDGIVQIRWPRPAVWPLFLAGLLAIGLMVTPRGRTNPEPASEEKKDVEEGATPSSTTDA